MNTLLPLFITFIAGTLLLRLLLLKVALKNKPWFILSCAGPVGLGMFSLLLFWSYVLYAPGAKGITLAASVGVVVFLWLWNQKRGLNLFQTFPRTPLKLLYPAEMNQPMRLLSLCLFILFCVSLIHFLFYFFGKTSWNIFGGWDARYFWNLKAKFFFRDPAQWQNMFSPVLDWSHPDYPLLLPGALAWGWIFSGKEMLLWPVLVDLLFILSITSLILWYLASFISPANAWLAGTFVLSIPSLRFWSTTQYADIPLAFFFLAASISLLLYYRFSQSPFLLVAGIFAGLSSWLKNEGLFFILWLYTVMVFIGILRRKDLKLTSTLIPLTLGVLVAFSAVLFAKIFLGVTGGEYLGSGRSFADYLSLLFADFEKTRFIALCFIIFKTTFSQWGGLWMVFLAALLLSGKKGISQGRWILLLLIGLIEFGYFLVLHVSPSEISFQVKVSLIRLMLHTAPLALLLTFEWLGPLFSQPRRPATL